MLFNKLYGSLNRAFLVRAYGKAKKCSVNLLTIVGAIDASTRCGNALYADKNLPDRICRLALHPRIGWVKQRLAAYSRNSHGEQLVHVHHAQFVAFNGMLWCEVGK